jgi:hypothetical protein
MAELNPRRTTSRLCGKCWRTLAARSPKESAPDRAKCELIE